MNRLLLQCLGMLALSLGLLSCAHNRGMKENAVPEQENALPEVQRDAPRGARRAAPPEISGSALFDRAVWGTRVMAEPNTSILCCWFVEDNGAGESGYVGVSGLRGYIPAGGGGLFQTVYELREGLKRQKLERAKIVPLFDGEVPKGWKIRGLTDDEVRILTSET
jgi:hypothetical protein